MQKKQEEQYNFGLLGREISYSFSRQYFKEKFLRLGLTDHYYENFDLAAIDELPSLLKSKPELRGLNVTIPYKEAVISYLDEIDPEAAQIGAVNTIKFLPNAQLKGFNTDSYGFKKSIAPHLKPQHQRALMLGTGGASKAIDFVLKDLGLETLYVSRSPVGIGQISYDDLTRNLLSKFTVIVNCTPLGTFPNIAACPNLEYDAISEQHLLFDLIYNPEITLFLKNGIRRGATAINGLKMLEFQAEKSWEIWTGKN